MDVMQIVTDRIMADLESGVIPWHKPWCFVDGAYNRVTGRDYSLLNQMLLNHAGEYATYRQWAATGGKLKRGAKSELVVFWKWPNTSDLDNEGTDQSNDRTDPDTGCNTLDHSIHCKKAPVLRYYKVYHISQVDGVEPIRDDQERGGVSNLEPIEAAEELLHQYMRREGIRLECGPSDQAYYSPLRDLIHLPHLSQFESSEGFYSTGLHEAVHSTGAARRLNRRGLQHAAFGSEVYSKEELIAELGAACLMHHLGIQTTELETNSSAYIQGWLRALRNDKRMIAFAAAQAEKAVKFILGDNTVSAEADKK